MSHKIIIEKRKVNLRTTEIRKDPKFKGIPRFISV